QGFACCRRDRSSAHLQGRRSARPRTRTTTTRSAISMTEREPDAAFLRVTAGTRALMASEKHKRRKPRGESTDAGHWGGPIRRSDEGPVMGFEQRDRGEVVVWSKQLATG